MKANEFIKEFGWGEAAAFLSLDSDVEIVYTSSFFDDLKRLVESHELVEAYGGLDKARKEAHKNCFEFNAPLLRAIADVESCR